MNDAGSALRDELRDRRDALIARYIGGGSVDTLLEGLSRAVDRLLQKVMRELRLSTRVALVAVGGYGRGELFPYSDVDVLVLLAQEATAADQQAIEGLVGLLWDFGLHLGHSVRTVAQCVEEAARDVTALTSMLEARRIVGPAALYAQFQAALAQAIEPRTFYQAKVLEQQQRHTKYEDSPYSLEPNVKESPGGLRDLHMVLWIARAAKLGASWKEMAQHGLLTSDESLILKRNERRLKDIRARLHIVAGRREDRLVFDVQNAVAQSAGIKATPNRRASEVLMQRYYWAAKAVTQLNIIVLQNIAHQLFPRSNDTVVTIDQSFIARNELLDIVSDGALERDPNAILRAFLVMEQHPELKAMSARLMRAVWHARALMDARYRADPVNRATFIQILQQPRGVIHELRRMNQLSVLGRYLPAFRRIVGQMQHDLFHVYTVDQHILMVIRNLRRFTMAEYAHEYPLCSQLMADFDRPWLLYVSALFHDIAKGRGGDHSTLGRKEVRTFAVQHGLGQDDIELLEFLVEQHLTMSQVAQKQDLTDLSVIQRFVATVKTERRLIALYLLTIADIRGTSPKVWNAWKGKLLEDLFLSTRRLLGGGSIAPNAVLEGRTREALRILSLYGLQSSARDELWSQLDLAYFLRHNAQDIAWHTRSLYQRVQSDKPIVRTRLSRFGEGAEVLIYTRDQRHLFARVAGYFDSHHLSILDARVHTTRHGYALDTFLVTDHGRAGHYRELLTRVEHELTEWIAAETKLPEPVLSRMSRQSRHFPVAPSVYLQPDERGRYYLLSIIGTDRIGLLYSIARVLAQHEITVHTAKVLVLGERAEDMFLIEGAELASARSQLKLESDLLAAMVPSGDAPQGDRAAATALPP